MSLIKIEHLKKEFPDVTPLKDVNIEINKGDVISVIGPSGSGKSTLLRCINLLEEPTSGTVMLDGEDITDPKYDITKARRKIGMVFQSFNLFNNLTVIENVMAAPVRLLKVPKGRAHKEGMELLKRVGLMDKSGSYPDELSGGQKQRAAIARAIAMKPEILLFDEPTSALDPTMVGEVLSLIRNLARDGMTMMIVTHEMQFARDVSNRILYVDEGGIYEEGTPQEIFENPKREKTRQFVRNLKILDFEIDPFNFRYADVVRKIERYAREAMLDSSARRNFLLTLDEIVIQNLIPKIKENPEGDSIKAFVEYSWIEDTLGVTYKWGGEKFDPITEGDELSAMLITKLSKDVSYKYEGENQITVLFCGSEES